MAAILGRIESIDRMTTKNSVERRRRFISAAFSTLISQFLLRLPKLMIFKAWSCSYHASNVVLRSAIMPRLFAGALVAIDVYILYLGEMYEW
jgi:hypothetical protein